MDQYRKSPRANFHDYDGGAYFITICTHNKAHYFGSITNGVVQLSEIGRFLDLQLQQASDYCPFIEIPLYVVMPNHLHAIIYINQSDCMLPSFNSDIVQRNPIPSFRANLHFQRHVPILSRYISSLKGVVTKHARQLGCDFAWQKRFYDHIIRNSKDCNLISEYILNNPANWNNDCYAK